MKRKKLKIFILMFLFLCFFNINYCYAEKKHINSNVTNDGDKLYLKITNNNTKVYGLLTSFEYDKNNLKFEKCTSDFYNVTVEKDMLLLESTKGKANTTIASCEFKILKKESSISLKLNDISLSDSENVIYNENILMNSEIVVEKNDDIIVEEPKEGTGNVQENPITSGKYIILLVIISCGLLISTIFINKKYKIFSFIVFLVLFSYPILAFANNKVTVELITEIRNVLLKKSTNSDNGLDIDKDNKITINDLIVSLIKLETGDEEPDDNESDTKEPENNDNKEDSGNTGNEPEKPQPEPKPEPEPEPAPKPEEETGLSTPIKPKGNETIVKNNETETLKVWIEKIDRSGRIDFYVTHIWAKEPYKQFKSQVPDNYGSELVTPYNLLKNAVKQNSLDNKLAVAINASGFVLNGVWGQVYYNANKNYNKTATCPLILSNGRVVRDISNEVMAGVIPPVFGLNKEGNLVYYNYPGGSKSQANIEMSQKIKNDGVLNTFTFAPVLVLNGKLNSFDTDKNVRQGLCQIDKNNFVFITDVYDEARTGFSFKELGEYMISLGCKTGFNLDGGGSTSLIYKEPTQTVSTISGSKRQITDIIYFHE